MHRQVITALLSLLAASAVGVWLPPTADAAAPLHQPIMITPSSGCGLLTAYAAGTGLPAWSGPPPSCGAGAFTLAFNQGNTRRRRRYRTRTVLGRPAALCRRLGSSPGCPREHGWGTRSPLRQESPSTRWSTT